MKAKPKILLVSATALMAMAPMAPAVTNMQTIFASTKQGKVKSRATTTVKTKANGALAYSFDGEDSSLSGYAWTKGKKLNVNGALYVWNKKENKAELFYHLTNKYQTMVNVKTSVNFPKVVRTNYLDVGDTFVKADDVAYVSGKVLKPINDAMQAEDNAKIAASELNELNLQDLVKKQKAVHSSVKYKLSNFNKRYNYDQTVAEAKVTLKKGNLSAARAQYLIWNLKTTQSELNGAKIKVASFKKLTSKEISAIKSLVTNVYSKKTETEDLHAKAIFEKKSKSTFKLVIHDKKDNNKLISIKTLKTKDFAQKR